MKHLPAFFAILALLLTSCSSDEPVLPNQSSEKNVSLRISPAQAVDIALAARESLDSHPTRASHSIKSLTPIGDFDKHLTRSQSAKDTLLYVINFDNDEGFAIVGADRRMLPVYAIADDGQFEISPTSNGATTQILNNILADAEERSSIPLPFPIDTTNVILPDTSNIHLPIDKPAFLLPKYGPYLSLHQRRIKPCIELSTYCFDKDGNQGQTGCMAISLEQYLSFFKWPLSYNGYQFDWDKINNGEDDDMIARILALLGLPENLDMHYEGVNAIGWAYNSNVARTLNSFEYTTPSTWYSNFFTYESVAQETLRTQPILCFASSTENNSGHGWVIDGLLAYYILDTHTNEYDTKYFLYHCCWGDEGKCDGFYYVADTKTFYGSPDILDPTDSGDFSNITNQKHDSNIGFMRNVVPNYDSIIQLH